MIQPAPSPTAMMTSTPAVDTPSTAAQTSCFVRTDLVVEAPSYGLPLAGVSTSWSGPPVVGGAGTTGPEEASRTGMSYVGT